jgi:hypothetical protein
MNPCTPGPWHLVGQSVVRDSNSGVIHIAQEINGNEANARLIAAAPDLLKALRYLLADHQRMFTEAHPDSTIAWRDCEEVKGAKAAIQKATQP